MCRKREEGGGKDNADGLQYKSISSRSWSFGVEMWIDGNSDTPHRCFVIYL